MSWIESGSYFLGSVSTRSLTKSYVSETNVRAKMRLHAALLRRKNKKLEEIADIMGKPKGTISKWLNKLNDGGLKAAVPSKQSGRPKRLTGKQLLVLKKDFVKDPEDLGYDYGFWSTGLAQEHVKKKFGARFVARHMRRLLQDMGFSLKKPRPHNHNADKAAQERFKKNSKGWFLDT